MRFYALLVPMLLWSSAAWPQTGGTPEKSGIQGRTFDAVTGAALRKVRLSLRGLDPNGGTAAATSDDSGAFTIQGLAPGHYRLSAERNGYNRQEYGARGQSTSGTTLTLAPGQQLTDIAFRLIPYGVIAGRIADEDSEPLAGAQISVYKYGYTRGRRRLVPAGNGITNDLGEYRVYGLAPGRYIVSAAPRPVITSNLPAESPGADAAAEPAYVPTFFPGTSDASSATGVDVGAGAKLQGVNFSLLKTRTARIRGRATNLLAGQAGAESNLTIYLFPKGGGLAGIRSTKVRDAQGNFEFRDVAPGSYTLSANYTQGGRRYAGNRRVEALGGQTIDGVNVEIGPGVVIAGNVRVESDAPVNLGNIAIELEPKGVEMTLQSLSGRLAENRTFQIANVPPGEYDIGVLGLPDEVYLKSILLGHQEVADAGISVESGGAAYQIEVMLSATGGAVDAMVQDDKDRPAPGVQVMLMPDEQRWNQDRLFKSGTTDQNGHCVIKGIAPGDYKLVALDGVDPEFLQDRDFEKKLLGSGEAVSVHEKERSSKQLKITPADGVR